MKFFRSCGWLANCRPRKSASLNCSAWTIVPIAPSRTRIRWPKSFSSCCRTWTWDVTAMTDQPRARGTLVWNGGDRLPILPGQLARRDIEQLNSSDQPIAWNPVGCNRLQFVEQGRGRVSSGQVSPLLSNSIHESEQAELVRGAYPPRASPFRLILAVRTRLKIVMTPTDTRYRRPSAPMSRRPLAGRRPPSFARPRPTDQKTDVRLFHSSPRRACD